MAAHSKDLRKTLENWALAGGRWRIVSLSDERAVVDLCTLTGEPMKRFESDDLAVIAYLRTTHSILDLN
jgi:hypothetical protein